MYIMNNPYLVNGLKLKRDESFNPYSYEDLKCTNLINMKVCNISISHFYGQQSGNYYTSRTSFNYRDLIFYDLSPIKVTKPLEFLIIGYKQIIGNMGKLSIRTAYNDTEMNIFNDPNLEDNSKFDISFSCGVKNYSDISCNLWKNSENIIYIFCQLKQNLINNNSFIKINTKKFIYKGLEINIVQQYDLSFVQLEKTIPFLYSKSQTINLEEGKILII